MTVEDLREEISIELENIIKTLEELSALQRDTEGREPTIREKTAAAAFLAQFYNGIENILKRISHYHAVPLPAGDTWHIELFKRFCDLPYPPLPSLFDSSLASDMAPYRKFRHVVHHGYGFQLEWERMVEGIDNVDHVYRRFKIKLEGYLNSL
jgi:hypothetical protein